MESKMASILISLLMVTNIFGAIAQNAGMPNSNSKGTIGLPLSNTKGANSVTDEKGAIMWYGWESRLVCIQLNRDGLSADFTESPLIQENGDPMPTTAFISLTMLEDGSLLWATQEGSTKPFVSKLFHIEDPQCNGNTSYAKFLGIMPEDIGIEALYTDALNRVYVMDTGQQHSSSIGNRLLRFTGDVVMGNFTYEVVNGLSYSVPDIDGLGPGINKTNGWVVDTPGFAIDSYDMYSVDYETGAFSFIGTTDGPYATHAINGSFFSDGKSRLYTITGIPQVGETSSTLYEINPDTGVTLQTLGSGPSGMGLTGSLAPGPSDFPDENKPPIADAGLNQTVNEGDTVLLNGSDSIGSSGHLVQDPCVVALWHMNRGSGNVIYDETANNHDGTIIGAHWSANGRFGNALVFDGVNDYVKIKPSDQIFGDNPDEWSYMVWFRTTNDVDDMGVISDYFGKHKIGSSSIHDPTVAIEFYIGHPGGGVPLIMVGFYSGGPGSTEGQWEELSYDGNWHFIAVTISKLDEVCNVYYDGYFLFDNLFFGALADGDFFDGDVLHIGAKWELTDFGDPSSGHIINPFQGSIDEIVLFNRSLSPEEILDYYYSGKEYSLDRYDIPAEIISYEWDFESDGIYDYQETESNAPDGAFDGKTTHIYGDNGIYKVTLKVSDELGANDTDVCNISVNNIIPKVEPITAQNATRVIRGVREEWVAIYNSPGDLSDRAKDITIDSLGNVYVTGGCIHPSNWSESDYITIKYDSSGNELWVARYNGTDNLADAATAIALDSWGNVYVTGASWRPHPRYPRPPTEQSDYLTIKYDSSGNQLWATSYNGTGNFDDQANDIAVDSLGNVYVTGQSHGIGTHYDYATIKYDTNGNELWAARFDIGGRKQEEAEGIAVDDSTGNVYVTGTSGTVAYDSNGNQLWVAGIHVCWAIAVGPSGNVYVAGVKNESGTGKDYATIAYDPLGNELWEAIYNGPGNANDSPRAIAVNPSGYVYVTGASHGSGTSMDYTTIAYDSSGNELWVARYNGPGNVSDWARGLAVHSSGNVYVTGECDYPGYPGISDYATVAYDSNGNELWVARYNGPGNDEDGAHAIAVDPSGYVYVTGYSKGIGTDDDYATIKYSSSISFECNEGSSVTFTVNISDPGSDDLTFTWNWGDGTPDTVTTYYNDGTGPEPVYDPITNEIKSPWGTYPFNATNTVSHTYGDDGVYTITLTVEDDDGGITTYTTNITVNNVAPTVDALPAVTINEFEIVTLTGHATDPGSDDLTFAWSWEYASWGDKTTIYYNDGIGPDPFPSPTINLRNVTEVATCQYGDDGIFKVTLTVVDDDGGSTTVMTNITVNNIAPIVTIESAIMDVEIGLRVAGRKYNNVSMTLYEEGNPIGHVSIERMPGSPNDQMAWIPVILNMTKTYNTTVIYTPEDPPNIGGNPVWIYIKFKNGTVKKIHHTFNVQQSKKRDSDHWNHVEPWEVDINAYLIGHAFEITSHITDPGSDDETLTFTYGSQVKTVKYLNNPPNPDPFPSPEVKPVDIIDTTTLTYEGPGTITLVVEDDDNIRLGIGQGTDSFDVV